MSLPARLRAFGISKALDYLERDPDANLPKLMDWLDKYTGGAAGLTLPGAVSQGHE